MEVFKIELSQVNAKGTKTFEAIANGINVRNESNLAGGIADFAKSTIELHEKLSAKGVKGLSKARIKASQPLACKITSIVDDTSISFELNQFGKFAKDSTKQDLKEVISLIIDHNSKFAHLWA